MMESVAPSVRSPRLHLPREVRAMSWAPNSNPPEQVAPLLALATQVLKAGQPADAVAPLREAALLQPSNPLIQHDIGLACLEVDRIAEAVEALQRAVKNDPRYGDA